MSELRTIEQRLAHAMKYPKQTAYREYETMCRDALGRLEHLALLNDQLTDQLSACRNAYQRLKERETT